MLRKIRIRAALVGIAALLATSAATGLKIELPADSAKLKPGPGVEIAAENCQTCHSVDYIQTQPSGKPFAFWKLEVDKMKKLYGAQITDDKVEPIAKYLTQAYGDGK